MEIDGARWPKRRGGEFYTTAIIRCENDTQVQVTESPTGRSVQIHVLADGEWRKVYP